MMLSIGGPTRDQVPADFAADLAELYAYTVARGPWQTVTVRGFILSTYIHVGREQFLEVARKQGATHVLWLDTDMTFPRELAVLLSIHEQPIVARRDQLVENKLAHQRPIVACNYRVRQASGLYTACRDGQRIATTANSTGLEAVEYAGMGAMLMRTDVVDGLGRPWFRHGLNEFGGDVGEDVMFCRGLGAAGYTIYIDHDLSAKVNHIGQYTYRTVERETVTA